MSDEFVFSSAGLQHELEMAMARATGWSPMLVKRMCGGDRLVHIREYLLGLAEITYPEHLINCDIVPLTPSGLMKVEEYQKGGLFKWDPNEVQLYLSEEQRKEKIQGHKLRTELQKKPVLNANVLDYLLANPHLIPESWKEKTNGNITYIFFWGTIYADSDGDLCVRCLYWFGDGWNWDSRWLGNDWGGFGPAALRK